MTKRRYRPSGFFVLRTPLLPFHYVEPLVRGDEETVRALLSDKIVHEAIYLASPSLYEGVELWLRDPSASRAKGVKEAAIRYLLRAASRPTPFGLFAGLGTGRLDKATSLHVPPHGELRRHTRLDMHYVSALAADLARDPNVRQQIRWFRSDALARRADGYRYPLATDAERGRAFEFTVVEGTPELDTVLERARQGAYLAELAATLVEFGHQDDDAYAYLNELIDAQLLVPEIAPSLLARVPSAPLEPHAPQLETVHAHLQALDAQGAGAPPQAYESIAQTLDALPTPVRRDRLFHVDLYKPTPALTLGRRPVVEIANAVDVLIRLQRGPSEGDPLLRFARRFRDRYEMRAVPLLEALDEDSGIEFGDVASASPPTFLEELALEPPPELHAEQDALLLRRAVHPGSLEWILTEEDLEALANPNGPPGPDALAVLATVAARSPGAVDDGDFLVRIHSAGGPSGAQLLGRFCHGDQALRTAVEAHVRAEEALQPDALFAEVLHFPDGRLGNILSRPALRAHALSYAGGGMRNEVSLLRLEDLDVMVRGDRVYLWSRAHNCEVLPRLASAHYFASAHLAVYRFLCALGAAGGGPGSFPWGSTRMAPFRPRVRYGRAVLDVATWAFPGGELAAGLTDDSSLSALRTRWALPRWLVVSEGDNTLPVDLEASASVEALRRIAKSRSTVILEELWPPPEELCASGPEGIFTHQIVVPFVREGDATAPAKVPRQSAGTIVRRFPPGSEWLFAKIYVSPGLADRVLVEDVAPFVRQARALGVDRWFFIRYADPEPHLRVRFHGNASTLLTEVLPRLHAVMAPRLNAGTVQRFELGMYEREIERYGGPGAIECAERIFEVDSDATLAVLDVLRGRGAGDEERVAYALACMKSDLQEVEPSERLHLVESIYDRYLGEHGASLLLKESLGRFARRGEGRPDTLGGYVAKRADALSPALREMRTRVGLDVFPSLLHMAANRVFRDHARAYELLLSRLARDAYRAEVGRIEGRTAR